jgi:hypothetical protein
MRSALLFLIPQLQSQAWENLGRAASNPAPKG